MPKLVQIKCEVPQISEKGFGKRFHKSNDLIVEGESNHEVEFYCGHQNRKASLEICSHESRRAYEVLGDARPCHPWLNTTLDSQLSGSVTGGMTPM